MTSPYYYLCDSLRVEQRLAPGESVDLGSLVRYVYGSPRVQEGDYYIKASVDSPSFIGEDNEANNHAIVGPLHIGPRTAARAWKNYR